MDILNVIVIWYLTFLLLLQRFCVSLYFICSVYIYDDHCRKVTFATGLMFQSDDIVHSVRSIKKDHHRSNHVRRHCSLFCCPVQRHLWRTSGNVTNVVFLEFDCLSVLCHVIYTVVLDIGIFYFVLYLDTGSVLLMRVFLLLITQLLHVSFTLYTD